MNRQLDISAEGRRMTVDEWLSRRAIMADKIELIDGKFYDRESDRLELLAMLLEQVGVDKAIKLGDPEVWREAVERIHPEI